MFSMQMSLTIFTMKKKSDGMLGIRKIWDEVSLKKRRK